MAQPSKLVRAQLRQGGANAPSSGSAGPTQPSGETEQPSPFDFLNYVPSPEHDARPLPAPGPPASPQSTGDTSMFDFLDHVPSSVLGPTQSMGPPRSISAPVVSPGPPSSTASAGGQSTYAFLDFLPSPVVGPVEVSLSVVTAGSAPGQQGVRTPSTASSAHASAPRDACSNCCHSGVKRRTDASGPMASASPGPMASATPSPTSTSAPIVAAQAAQHPAPYDFLQHIPASQHMARDRTASLVRTNMEVNADPQPPVTDDVGPESEEEDREMEDDSRQELPVPSSTSAPWPQIRIPVHLP
ncbi:hypothetical protein EI94DRAFT_1814920 [Lactarius quietus]|nr:hypothetical protein EI94DRAFT_1814920 [Lactarius quietus]